MKKYTILIISFSLILCACEKPQPIPECEPCKIPGIAHGTINQIPWEAKADVLGLENDTISFSLTKYDGNTKIENLSISNIPKIIGTVYLDSFSRNKPNAFIFLLSGDALYKDYNSRPISSINTNTFEITQITSDSITAYLESYFTVPRDTEFVDDLPDTLFAQINIEVPLME